MTNMPMFTVYIYIIGMWYTLVNKRKVYFGLLADISVFLLQPNI